MSLAATDHLFDREPPGLDRLVDQHFAGPQTGHIVLVVHTQIAQMHRDTRHVGIVGVKRRVAQEVEQGPPVLALAVIDQGVEDGVQLAVNIQPPLAVRVVGV